MPLERRKPNFTRLGAEALASLTDVPAAIAGDAMNRARCMASGIKPLTPTMRLLGQARTVQVPAGDNAAIHVAVAIAEPGNILVIDAAGFDESAVWGGILTQAARLRGVSGVVLDGATRDGAEISASGFPVFCRAVTPRGGQKTDFGMVDGPVAVGGVSVCSGDIVIADSDGIAIIPLAEFEQVKASILKVQENEIRIFEGLKTGKTSAELLGIPIPPYLTQDFQVQDP